MANSLAFWFDTTQDDKTPETELHINYWSLSTLQKNYLDIGVKLKHKDETLGFSSLNIYFPFKINEKNYYPELGKNVAKSSDLIELIFNSQVTQTTPKNNQTIQEIDFNETKLRFFTQFLLSETNVKSEEKSKGTVLKFSDSLFKLEETNSQYDMDSYFRFRIILDENDDQHLKQNYLPKDALITNYFESTEMIDFRVNESRILPDDIKSNFQYNIRANASKFKKPHRQ